MKPTVLDMGVKKQKREEEYVTTKAHKGKEGRKKGKLLFPFIRLLRLRGSFLKFFIHPQFHCCLLFAVIIFFSGCELYGTIGVDDVNKEGALPAMLVGKWAYTQPGSSVPAEIYTIADTGIIKYGYGSDSSPTDYRGTIVFVSNYSSDSGVMIIEYVDPGGKPTYTEYNGKPFTAVYYRKLHSTWVQLANVTVLPAPPVVCADVDSLEEAIAKFTRMKTGLYVDWSIVQPQTRIW
jgi:hypothetical protein